jgi:hypothetical protein
MNNAVAQFAHALRASLTDGTFVKATLSEPAIADESTRNVYARLISLRGSPALSLVWRQRTRDVTKNFAIGDGVTQLVELIGCAFQRAHLFTTGGDWVLQCGGAKAAQIERRRPTFTIVPDTAHDREKVRFISPDSAFLCALGITNASGKPRPAMSDKLRQIERFTEIVGHLLARAPLLTAHHPVRVVDLGAGKGYLTFALQALLASRGVPAEIIGIERRADLAAGAERVARELGVDALHFQAGEIADVAPGRPIDVLVALHACDTATDDALHLGVRAGAALILASPCCQKELRSQLAPPALLSDVFKHGILHERETEIITDALRALLLEIHGYDTQVFEFISLAHTARNTMIAAVKRAHAKETESLRKRLRDLLAFYGIKRQRLADLLGET